MGCLGCVFVFSDCLHLVTFCWRESRLLVKAEEIGDNGEIVSEVVPNSLLRLLLVQRLENQLKV